MVPEFVIMSILVFAIAGSIALGICCMAAYKCICGGPEYINPDDF